MNISNPFENKIKDKILNSLNEKLYSNLNLSLYETNHYFGYYNGYIYKLIDRVYYNHGSEGLRKEIEYIIQYLRFLFIKLESNYTFPDYVLVVYYFRMYYRHFSQRKTKALNQLSFSF